MPLSPDDLAHSIEADLANRQAGHHLRAIRCVEPLDPTHFRVEGKVFLHFASNNYLGLTHHPRVIQAVADAATRYGAGSAASPLICGHTLAHEAAQRALAHWKQTQDALLLPSGYQANLAAIQTLAVLGELAGGVRFLIDKLAHASLVDAVRAAGKPFRVFPHNHLGKLRRLLADAPERQLDVVVTESIFSMDGDAAELPGIVQLKSQHPFILLLDEAHGSGVYGPGGAGYAAHLQLNAAVDISVVTLSKALGCSGGAICARRDFCQAVVNHGRAFIYSTGIAPAAAAAVEASIAVMRDEPHHQQRLRELSSRLRRQLAEMGLAPPGGDSPIIPLILGDEARALEASAALLKQGIWVPAVRPPTVPRGTSRLRITLGAFHTDEDLARLLEAIQSLCQHRTAAVSMLPKLAAGLVPARPTPSKQPPPSNCPTTPGRTNPQPRNGATE